MTLPVRRDCGAAAAGAGPHDSMIALLNFKLKVHDGHTVTRPLDGPLTRAS